MSRPLLLLLSLFLTCVTVAAEESVTVTKMLRTHIYRPDGSSHGVVTLQPGETYDLAAARPTEVQIRIGTYTAAVPNTHLRRGRAAARAPQPGVAANLPEKLEDKQGHNLNAEKALNGKFVGLYFSAGWCGPCKVFTPELIRFRNRHQRDFEVVLVGSDRSAEQHRAYMADQDMPWLAIPYGSRQTRDLMARFEIIGIPTLVIMDAQGNLVSRFGKRDVEDNPEGAVAAWKSRS